jgi:hypothetical protein
MSICICSCISMTEMNSSSFDLYDRSKQFSDHLSLQACEVEVISLAQHV